MGVICPNKNFMAFYLKFFLTQDHLGLEIFFQHSIPTGPASTKLYEDNGCGEIQTTGITCLAIDQVLKFCGTLKM